MKVSALCVCVCGFSNKNLEKCCYCSNFEIFFLAILLGRRASINQFPFIVSLRNSLNQHIDSGTIISHNFIISSAWIVTFKPVRVVAGAVNLNSGGTGYDLASKVLHPRYNNQTFENNLSLMKTKYKITFTDAIKAISLNVYEIGVNVPTTAAGWGYSEVKNTE